MTTLDQLSEWIGTGALETIAARQAAIGGCLDLRDRDPFDSAWVAANEDVQRLLRETPPTADCCKQVEDIARRAFIATAVSADAAPYISDDLRLIAEALLVGSHSRWIAGLLESYARGTLPCGDLAESDRSLEDVAGALRAE